MIKKPWILLAGMLATGAYADEVDTNSFLNHVTFSARFGLNIDVKYGPRLTSGGGAYNFLDGYVLRDSKAQPGEAFAFDPTGTYPPPGGITHYWGYDNSARQDDGANKEILMTALAGGSSFDRSEDDDGAPGFEISYQRELGTRDRWHYGLEGAVNYLDVSVDNHFDFTGDALQYGFPYTFNGVSGNSPPPVYQGTYELDTTPGANNFDIGGLPSSTNNVTINLAGNGKFEADVWGFRLGPYLSRPIGERAAITLVGGLALGLVDAHASWSQTLTVDGSADPTVSGSGDDTDLLVGYYLGANFSWKLSERWGLNAGVQFQDLGKYENDFGGQEAELDMGQTIFVAVGLSYSF